MLFLFLNCNRIDDNSLQSSLFDSFQASIDDDTKASLNEEKEIIWNSDDAISVFRSLCNERFIFSGNTGDKSGTFIKSDEQSPDVAFQKVYAVYPYNSSYSTNDNEAIRIASSNIQMFSPNSFDPKANIMTAKTNDISDRNLKFRNLCGYLVVKLYGHDKINSISVHGNSHEVLAGNGMINFKNEYPELKLESDGLRDIHLEVEENLVLSCDKQHCMEFWIVVPPMVFEHGLTVIINTENCGEITKTTSSKVIITRNCAQRVAPIEIGKKKKTITLWGDSFTHGVYAYAPYLKEELGDDWIVYDGGISGDTTLEIATREGGIKTYTKSEFEFPNTSYSYVSFGDIVLEDSDLTTEAASRFQKSRWGQGTALLNPCLIDGIECSVVGNTAARIFSGQKRSIVAHSEIITQGHQLASKCDVIVIYMGQNGGWANNYDVLVRQHWAMINVTENKKYIVMSWHNKTDPECVSLYDKAFGSEADKYCQEAYDGKNHVIHLRKEVNARAEELLIRTGVYNDPSEISESDRKDINNGIWPRSFNTSATDPHPNEYGEHAMAILIKEKMEQLGYLNSAENL